MCLVQADEYFSGLRRRTRSDQLSVKSLVMCEDVGIMRVQSAARAAACPANFFSGERQPSPQFGLSALSNSPVTWPAA